MITLFIVGGFALYTLVVCSVELLQRYLIGRGIIFDSWSTSDAQGIAWMASALWPFAAVYYAVYFTIFYPLKALHRSGRNPFESVEMKGRLAARAAREASYQ